MSKKKEREKIHHDNLESAMKVTALAAVMGNVLCETQAEKNAWKMRMLKSGLSKMGLSVPDDWDSLPEDEKERRLDVVIAALKK